MPACVYLFSVKPCHSVGATTEIEATIFLGGGGGCLTIYKILLVLVQKWGIYSLPPIHGYNRTSFANRSVLCLFLLMLVWCCTDTPDNKLALLQQPICSQRYSGKSIEHRVQLLLWWHAKMTVVKNNDVNQFWWIYLSSVVGKSRRYHFIP